MLVAQVGMLDKLQGASGPPGGQRGQLAGRNRRHAGGAQCLGNRIGWHGRKPQLPAAGTQANGVYLQLGAFAARENAEAFRARLMREFAWLQDAIQLIAGGALFRLHLGPYRSQDEARAIADRIRSEISLSPLLIVR